jgi:hypothetical protein
LKLPQLNAVQKSLLIPAGTSFVLGGLFGVGGYAVGTLIGLVGSPIIYWKGADKEKAKWKRGLTAALLASCGMTISAVVGVGGCETILRAVRPAAYKQYQKETAGANKQPSTKEENGQADTTDWRSRVSHGEPAKKDAKQGQLPTAPATSATVKIKAIFTTTRYFADAKPEITQGSAVLDQSAKAVEWHTEVKDGGYAGYKYYHRCSIDGKYWEKDEYSGGVWKQDTEARCKISADADNTPRQFKIVGSDGFVSQAVQITTSAASKPKVAVTPIRALPDKTTVTARCKELAKAGTATGKINWNAFGTGDPRWYAPAATIILSGKTKNEYGTTVPFVIECKGNSDGTVKLVETTL